MTSTSKRIDGVRKEVDYQKLPTLLIASSLVLAIRTARWPTPHSEGLEHNVRAVKTMPAHLPLDFPIPSLQEIRLGMRDDEDVPY